MMRRAKIILACLEGKRNDEIAAVLGIRPNTIGEWRQGGPWIKSACKRHGTVNLFAALEIATGVIRGKAARTKKRVDFQAFMDDVVADLPPGREIHVILDNLCTHKKNEDWLGAHPNVTLHFTPTSASWLNPVEV